MKTVSNTMPRSSEIADSCWRIRSHWTCSERSWRKDMAETMQFELFKLMTRAASSTILGKRSQQQHLVVAESITGQNQTFSQNALPDEVVSRVGSHHQELLVV